MDAESEAVILDTIRELAQSATVIMITHRMANAVTADQVVVFDTVGWPKPARIRH